MLDTGLVVSIGLDLTHMPLAFMLGIFAGLMSSSPTSATFSRLPSPPWSCSSAPPAGSDPRP
jgi:uncharacterized membrane protein AbrB (regulator of aidB expression)